MVLLSVLIPSLTSRTEHLNRITSLLTRQINAYKLHKEVEILTLIDNREQTTGFKRNALLNKSNGKFIVFVDDDDLLSDDYLKLICDLIRSEKELDCIGINGIYTCNGQKTPFETSLEHHWEIKNGMYTRTINHISPIKRQHAILVRFPNKTIGEDYEWTMKLKKLNVLKVEKVIKNPIYFYNFVSNKRY